MDSEPSADFSYPFTLIQTKGIAIGGAGSPLHAESAAPTGVVAATRKLNQAAISCLRACRRFPWFSFPGRHGFRTIPGSCDFVGDLDHFTHWHFHSGHGLHFARVSECLARGIVGAIGELDTGAHVVDP